MDDSRRIVAVSILLWAAAFIHAVLTWPPLAVIAFFFGGGFLTFIAEAIGINLGWLEHHISPKLSGVPLYLLFAWTGTIYIPFRLSLLVFEMWIAAVVTAVTLTVYDLLTDHYGVEEGYWSYTGGLSGPRFRGVPWWNYTAWLVLSFTTVSLAIPFI